MTENFHHDVKCPMCGKPGIIQSEDPTRDENRLTKIEKDLSFLLTLGEPESETMTFSVRLKDLQELVFEVKRLRGMVKDA